MRETRTEAAITWTDTERVAELHRLVEALSERGSFVHLQSTQSPRNPACRFKHGLILTSLREAVTCGRCQRSALWAMGSSNGRTEP